MLNSTQTEQFVRFGFITIGLIYLVILAGGIVRATGSGMGCPDWPKCFGRWIPPTDVSQLQFDYQDVYANRGYKDTEFNVVKTWIEYLNRLLGVLVGLFVFFTAVFSFRFLKTHSIITFTSILAFLAVAFQGWLGSVVVSNNLSPYIVTLHMMVALFIVAIVLFAVVKAQTIQKESEHFNNIGSVPISLLIIMCVLSLVQIVLGTQVREAVDEISLAKNYTDRNSWIDMLGAIFKVHRSFSLMVLTANAIFIWKIFSSNIGFLKSNSLLLGALILVEIVSGIILAYFGIPPFAQPLHLLLGSLIFGAQVYILILFYLGYKRIKFVNSFNFASQ